MTDRMLAVVKEGPGPGFGLRQLPLPEFKPGTLRGRVRAVGICGTDVPIFEGVRPVPYPLVPGHEFAGEIESVGKDVPGWQPGDRGAAGLVIGCGECAACRRGMRTCARASAKSASTSLGADRVVTGGEDIAEATGGQMASLVVEATGDPGVFERIPPVCAAGARVLLLGIFHHETWLMPARLVRRELRYEGSFCYNWTDFEHSLELIRRGQVVTQHVVTHTCPFRKSAGRST